LQIVDLQASRSIPTAGRDRRGMMKHFLLSVFAVLGVLESASADLFQMPEGLISLQFVEVDALSLDR
jgi:hypothetical protein